MTNFKTTTVNLWSPEEHIAYISDTLVVLIDAYDKDDWSVDFVSRVSWEKGELDTTELTGLGAMKAINQVIEAVELQMCEAEHKPYTLSVVGSCEKRHRIYRKVAERKGYTTKVSGIATQIVLREKEIKYLATEEVLKGCDFALGVVGAVITFYRTYSGKMLIQTYKGYSDMIVEDGDPRLMSMENARSYWKGQIEVFGYNRIK